MQLRKTNQEAPDINLTSLIDVVFLLLIFFMISSTFEKSASLKISLPEAEATEKTQELKAVVLAIDADGAMALDNQRLPNNRPETLKNALQQLGESRWEQGIILHADADVAHKYVVKAMDVATELGIRKLAIATLKQEPTLLDTATQTAGEASSADDSNQPEPQQ